MKLILAQGNPGSQYSSTRHNVGFAALDHFATKNDLKFQAKPKFLADIAEFTHDDNKVLLVKPSTFYNETGQCARALIDFYKLDPTSDILVVHDDLALPFGTLRTREKGSDAGNNGIKSLNAHIGPQYARLRIGIYNDLRDRMNDVDFVLGRFSKDEEAALVDVFEKTDSIITDFLNDTFQTTTHN